jgi:hypothetical protein
VGEPQSSDSEYEAEDAEDEEDEDEKEDTAKSTSGSSNAGGGGGGRGAAAAAKPKPKGRASAKDGPSTVKRKRGKKEGQRRELKAIKDDASLRTTTKTAMQAEEERQRRRADALIPDAPDMPAPGAPYAGAAELPSLTVAMEEEMQGDNVSDDGGGGFGVAAGSVGGAVPVAGAVATVEGVGAAAGAGGSGAVAANIAGAARAVAKVHHEVVEILSSDDEILPTLAPLGGAHGAGVKPTGLTSVRQNFAMPMQGMRAGAGAGAGVGAGTGAVIGGAHTRVLPAFLQFGSDGSNQTMQNPLVQTGHGIGVGRSSGIAAGGGSIKQEQRFAAGGGIKQEHAVGGGVGRIGGAGGGGGGAIVVSSDEEADAGPVVAKSKKVKSGKSVRMARQPTFVDDNVNSADRDGNVLVNFLSNPKSEPKAHLVPELAKVVKPHQIGGVRFMWENLVETDELYKTTDGFGCILAHSMGLGKTIQVVSFVHGVRLFCWGRHVLLLILLEDVVRSPRLESP